MRFANAQLLWLLLVLPPTLLAFLWWAWRRKQALLAQFIEPRLLAGLTAGVSPTRRKLRLTLLVAAVAFLVFTLARLQWGFDWEETKQRGLDIVVAIDTSKSMLADDIAPNRLTRAKLAALDLMQQAKADRLGLVTFAGVAFLQCPLTVDDAAFRQSVESLDVNTIPQGGTAIADAIETAQAAFKAQDNEKALVLFTDGEDHDSHALGAAEKAAQAGMRIFTIGIGTPEGELLRIKDAQGRTDFVRDEDGNVVKSHLNEDLLREIAEKTGAFYLPLRGADTIDKLYANGLSKLTKTESAARLVKRYRERFYWPLALAILFLLAEMFLAERKTEPRAAKAPLTATRAGLKPAVAGVLLLALALPGRASPTTALRDYQAGRYQQALKEYGQLLEQTPGDPRLEFNAGAAAYRATNYDGALQHFKAVLTARDVKLQQAAYYNLGNTYFRRGETAKDLGALLESWQVALTNFQNAVTLDKTDPDARYNLALVKNTLEQLREAIRLAKAAKASADGAVRRRQYHQALEIMQRLVQSNFAAKQFQEFTQRLQNIDAIETPSQP